MSDEATQLALVVAALDAAGAVPHTVDELQRMSSRPAYYCEVNVTRRFGGNPRGGRAPSPAGWRITTREVAQTENNAREVRRLTALALEGVALTGTTPVAFESADPISGDDGWFSGLETWTYST